MPAIKQAPTISIALDGKQAIIKIAGRANFTSSIDLKTVVNELQQRGFAQFSFELSDCVTMDSTFLGVLAGLAIRIKEASSSDGAGLLELVNPNPRVTDLLENLGVCHLFQIRTCEKIAESRFEPAPSVTNAEKKQLSRACLEAHQTLMDANPKNISKFKEVTRFLAEDLKKPDQ